MIRFFLALSVVLAAMFLAAPTEACNGYEEQVVFRSQAHYAPAVVERFVVREVVPLQRQRIVVRQKQAVVRERVIVEKQREGLLQRLRNRNVQTVRTVERVRINH